MKIIIADTSSLILFSKINKIALLTELFKTIIITAEVAEEFGEIPDGFKISKYSNLSKFHELNAVLGKGEASGITLALETDNSILLIDEKKGRKIAKENGIEIIGSLGAILLAKKHDKIESVKEILELIQKTNFRVSDSIIEYIIKESGE